MNILLSCLCGAVGLVIGWWAPVAARRLDVRWDLNEAPEEQEAPPARWHRVAIGIATAASAGVAALRLGIEWRLPLVLAMLAWLALVAAVDLRSRLIPNRLTYPALVLSPLSIALWPSDAPIDHLFGGFFGAMFFLIAHLLSRRGIGLGDVKLALVLGIYLGVERAAVALVFALLMGGAAAVVALFAGLSRKDTIAYGPMLSAGGALALVAGDQVWQAYMFHLGSL